MCDVHLVETCRRHLHHWRGSCSFCERLVDGAADLVVGYLDDGSLGMLEFTTTPIAWMASSTSTSARTMGPVRSSRWMQPWPTSRRTTGSKNSSTCPPRLRCSAKA